MGDKDRKLVHEMGHLLGLKSKSVGHGRSRFPIVYKTSRSSTYDEKVFENIDARLMRRYMPRKDRQNLKGSTAPMRGPRGGNAAASHRNGDVVGAGAPELGGENKGRAMLEKMGWSHGTALGALNNKGIMQPVTHVVKTTKAGLG